MIDNNNSNMNDDNNININNDINININNDINININNDININQDSDKYNYKMDNNNQNFNIIEILTLNTEEEIEKLEYLSSGSFGVVLKSSKENYVYKLTKFSDFKNIIEMNFVETIYLNFFKNKYKILYDDELNIFLPIQNETTELCLFEEFSERYKIEKELYVRIKNKLEIRDHHMIIVNKMKYYYHDLSSWLNSNNKINTKQFDNKTEELFEKKIKIIKNLILGLHLIHSNNLSHGDLKSSNILLNEDEIKIIDFGGFKYKFNPKYECSCTLTYRSPEDLEYEQKYYNNKHRNNHDFVKNLSIKKTCPIKSDLWSLGIIFNELIYDVNPIGKKYIELKKDLKQECYLIEEKILEYIIECDKKIKNYDINRIQNNTNEYKSNLLINKIESIIDKLLINVPEQRISLEHICIEMFNEKLPNFEENVFKFEYNINSKYYFEKFLNFRKFYYPLIKNIIMLNNELFLYPLIINLFDRFLVKIINISIEKNFKISEDYELVINLFEQALIIGNKQDNETKTDIKIKENCLNSLGIFTTCFYTISKILICKKLCKINNMHYNLIGIFTKELQKNFCSFDEFPQTIICNIKHILLIMDWDIVRPKLFFYKTSTIENIKKIVKIIEDYDIENIIKMVE